MRPRLEFFSQTSPRVVLLVLQAARLRPESEYRRSPAAAMLPASLLRRPGLSRLVRQARAYAEAAAAPAPAAGPGQMSFTFASPTQVRTLFRTPDPRPFLVWSLSESSNPHSGSGIRARRPPGCRHPFWTPDRCPSSVWSESEPANPYSGPGILVPPPLVRRPPFHTPDPCLTPVCSGPEAPNLPNS